MRLYKAQSGTGLVEVVVAAAIIVLVVLSLVAAFAVYLRQGLEIPARVQGSLLTEEGVEALKFLRDNGWTANVVPLTSGTTYYLYATSSTWKATTTTQILLAKFYRKVVLSAVNRDSSGNIVASGGSVDLGTRKAVVTVSWLGAGGTTTRSISTYITNLFSN